VPYNEQLEGNIEKIIGSGKKIEKRRMFGGICYLMNGNMCFGIYKEYLIVRTGIEVAEKKLKEKNVKPFDITGKAMKGWVMVGKQGWKSQGDLKEWLDLGKEYGLTLPKKQS
jgi:TfoX/Sxy family transcriptional regulator of competence genes